MHPSRIRQIPLCQTAKTRTRHPLLLASPVQAGKPCTAHFPAETSEPFQVVRHRVVVEVATQDFGQPCADLPNRFVSPSFQRISDRREARSQPLFHRQSQYLEAPLAGLRAAVREAEKVERLWSSFSSLVALRLCVAAKLDQPRLLRVERQSKFGKAFVHCCQKPSCFVFVLESKHAVVSVSNQDDVASGVMLAPVLRPGIEDVMQVDVGQQWGDDRPLRGAPFGLDSPAIFDDSGLQPLPDQSQEAAVGNPVLQECEHPVVVDGVKVRTDVGVQYPSNLSGLDSHPDRVERVVLPAPRSESIRKAEKIRLVDRTHDLDYGLLHDLVFDCGNSERAQLAVRLGNKHAPRGLRTIRAGVYLPVQFMCALVENAFVVLPRHAVHTDRRRPFEVVKKLGNVEFERPESIKDSCPPI